MLPVVINSLCGEDPLCMKLTMPRVVPDQREKFDNDELFRKLSRECEIRYSGYRERLTEERQIRLQSDCQEGHADISYPSNGINLQLTFVSNTWSERHEDRLPTQQFVDFEREPGKVHLKSQFIMNGVCVIWRGWIDLQRLDGSAWLEFDDDRAQVEDRMLRQQLEDYNARLRGIEDQQRAARVEQERRAELEAEARRQLAQQSPTSYCSSSSSSE